MAKISINRAHKLSHGKAREAAELLAADLHRKFSLRYEWEGDHIEFHRPGVTGRLRVAPDELDLYVELGFLLAGFRGAIENEIHRQLDEILGKYETVDGESVRVARGQDSDANPPEQSKKPAEAKEQAEAARPAARGTPGKSHATSRRTGGKRQS